MGKGVKDNVSMEEENKESGTTTKQLPTSTEKADGTEAGTTADEKKTETGTTAATASTQKSAQSMARGRTYVVKKGDSLVSISRKMYGSRKYMYKILDANKIGPKEHIYPGQKLIIPSITK